MKKLKIQDLIAMHNHLICQFGGINGIRDYALLESAVSTPFQTFNGEDLYGSITEKAAQIAFGLIKNHPFLDGNKRVAAEAMLYFLEINDISIEANSSEVELLFWGVANDTKNREDILDWINNHY